MSAVARVSRAQALAWRLDRHLLGVIGSASVTDVVGALCGVQAQVPSTAELAVRVRSKAMPAGAVDKALARGDIVRTWAMRGTLHLLTPDAAGTFLALIAAARPWEARAWSNWFGLTPAVIEAMRDAAHEALAAGPMAREDLIEALVSRPGLGHVGTPLRESWGTAFKPLAWQGVLAFGPMRDGRPTFVRPDRVSPSWPGLADAEDAGPRAVAAYLSAHGPATVERFQRWLGRANKRQVKAWWEAAGERLARVEVDGEAAHVLARDLDALLASRPSRAVRLLPGFDQWIMGRGTDDPRTVPPARRAAVSRQAGWISPVVLVGGVVCGTWSADRNLLRIEWFAEAGRVPEAALAREVARVCAILARPPAFDLVTV